ncbi:hypothetical protein PDESU_04081 [Pontiella desulfatans]|uniref:Uncharacterized protein n=1 Tax=Pontiella desulfatans TaxID=2750659 RepID=A0A6C2U5Z4_PONDE|nr:hypothetical protein [Pontiella desulfatans]VGO15498.1 hypothetical protein PDESU_04081 [Pontiella desulfatans]
MKKTYRRLFVILFFFGVAPHVFCAEKQVDQSPIPTHADAAIVIAKFSGLFDRYVSSNASLSECVSFLNKKGVYFGLLEVVSGKEFTVHDCARVLGQAELVFAAEAQYDLGKVKLPKDIDSWEEFCIMNHVQYVEAYKAITQSVASTRQ